MKKIREIYIAVRDFLHIVGFFTLAYWMLSKLYLDLGIGGKIALGLVLSALGYGVGHGYEGLRYRLFKEPTDVGDGNRSWLGFTLGVILVMINAEIQFINTYMFFGCLILLGVDVIYAIYKKYKKAKVGIL